MKDPSSTNATASGSRTSSSSHQQQQQENANTQQSSYAMNQWQKTAEAHEQRSVGQRGTNLWQINHTDNTDEYGAKIDDGNKGG